MSAKQTITRRLQALFFLNGLGLFVVGILFGWAWFFHLLQEIVLWPLPVQIDVQVPGDSRAFRMGHMEAITQGLLLMALAFGGGPFKESLANDVIYLLGWPPVVCVHILFALAVLGVYRYLQVHADDHTGDSG